MFLRKDKIGVQQYSTERLDVKERQDWLRTAKIDQQDRTDVKDSQNLRARKYIYGLVCLHYIHVIWLYRALRLSSYLSKVVETADLSHSRVVV